MGMSITIDPVGLMKHMTKQADNFGSVASAAAEAGDPLCFQIHSTAALVLYGIAVSLGSTMIDQPQAATERGVPQTPPGRPVGALRPDGTDSGVSDDALIEAALQASEGIEALGPGSSAREK